MNIIRSSLFICFILFFINKSSSQNQVGIVASFQHGDLTTNSSLDYFDSNTTIGFGLSSRYHLGRNVYLTSLLTYQKVGWFSLDYNKYFDLYWKGKSLNMSSDIGYYLINSKILKVGASIGLTLGILLDEEFRIIEGPSTISEFYTRQSITTSLDFNFDLIFNISDHLSLNLRPHWNNIFHHYKSNYNDRKLGFDVLLMYTLPSN